MDINYYQELCKETQIYSDDLALLYPALGLAGEVGEVLNKVKKIYRDDGGHLTDEHREAVGKEIGDALWYMASLATDLGVSLQDCALGNVQKLHSRKIRGVIGGSGDDR